MHYISEWQERRVFLPAHGPLTTGEKWPVWFSRLTSGDPWLEPEAEWSVRDTYGSLAKHKKTTRHIAESSKEGTCGSEGVCMCTRSRPWPNPTSHTCLSPAAATKRASLQTRDKKSDQVTGNRLHKSEATILTTNYLQLLLFIDSGLEKSHLQASDNFRQARQWRLSALLYFPPAIWLVD